ncbi:MAG: hypothetical protein ACK559_23315, partial [bacterium]
VGLDPLQLVAGHQVEAEGAAHVEVVRGLVPLLEGGGDLGDRLHQRGVEARPVREGALGGLAPAHLHAGDDVAGAEDRDRRHVAEARVEHAVLVAREGEEQAGAGQDGRLVGVFGLRVVEHQPPLAAERGDEARLEPDGAVAGLVGHRRVQRRQRGGEAEEVAQVVLLALLGVALGHAAIGHVLALLVDVGGGGPAEGDRQERE